jgi:hypothetical protein
MPKSQEELISEAENSALYRAIMGGRDAGEEAILRNASATGNLRSGGTITDLAEFNRDLENRALLSGYEEAVRRGGLERDALRSAYGEEDRLRGLDRDAILRTYGEADRLRGLDRDALLRTYGEADRLSALGS